MSSNPTTWDPHLVRAHKRQLAARQLTRECVKFDVNKLHVVDLQELRAANPNNADPYFPGRDWLVEEDVLGMGLHIEHHTQDTRQRTQVTLIALVGKDEAVLLKTDQSLDFSFLPWTLALVLTSQNTRKAHWPTGFTLAGDLDQVKSDFGIGFEGIAELSELHGQKGIDVQKNKCLAALAKRFNLNLYTPPSTNPNPPLTANGLLPMHCCHDHANPQNESGCWSFDKKTLC